MLRIFPEFFILNFKSFTAFLTIRLKYVIDSLAFRAYFIALLKMRVGNTIETQDLQKFLRIA